LRHCATSRNVAGSIPNGVTGNVFDFIFPPPPRTKTLRSTQPLTGILPGGKGKGGRCVRLTTLPYSCADCLEIWEPQPPGTLRACPGIALPFWLETFQQVHTRRGRTIGGFRPPTNLQNSGKDRTVRRPKLTILLKATIYGQCDAFLVNRQTRQPMTLPDIQMWNFAEIRRVIEWVLSVRTRVTVR